jgi:hypothetical protein
VAATPPALISLDTAGMMPDTAHWRDPVDMRDKLHGYTGAMIGSAEA